MKSLIAPLLATTLVVPAFAQFKADTARAGQSPTICTGEVRYGSTDSAVGDCTFPTHQNGVGRSAKGRLTTIAETIFNTCHPNDTCTVEVIVNKWNNIEKVQKVQKGVLPTTSASTPITGEIILGRCTNNETSQQVKDHCLGYIMGVADAFALTLRDRICLKDASLSYSLVSGGLYTREDLELSQIVILYAMANPKISFPDIVYRALLERFPCK